MPRIETRRRTAWPNKPSARRSLARRWRACRSRSAPWWCCEGSKGFRMFLDNALKPLLLPASGGVVAAVAFFAMLMSVPGATLVSAPPPSLDAATPPRILALAPISLPGGDEDLVLVTHVNSDGKVLD